MTDTKNGSTGRLLQLCAGYFFFYVITGLTVKYFLGKAELGFPGMHGIQFLVYGTGGAVLLTSSVVLAARWYKLFESSRRIKVGPMQIPIEFLYIVPSGIMTAVVIPTTTLMYTLPISVMVAMVIMRAGVIVISRAVDSIQIKQGILKKKVFWEENIAVVFALAAAGVHIFWGVLFEAGKGHFDFLASVPAMVILGSYLSAYAVRIYIMNYFKNTRPKNDRGDNRGFFAIEQLASASVILVGSVFLFNSVEWFGWMDERVVMFHQAMIQPHPEWLRAAFFGTAFGGAAFFSVFLFMYKGRTATFAGLVNRLTSLVAGTTSTLLFAVMFAGRWPKPRDWMSLAFILIAVVFLTRAENKRAKELKGVGPEPRHPKTEIKSPDFVSGGAVLNG